MKHKLILSQSQIDEICNGDSSYLDGLSSKPDVPEDYANEITVGGGIIDSYPDPLTTDEFGRQLARQNGMFGGRRCYHGDYVTMYEGKKKDWMKRHSINETNQALDHQEITAVIGDGPNAEKVTGNENMLSTRLSRAEDAGNEEEAKALRKALDNRRKPIENRKKNLKNLGIDNVYQKAGGKKNSGNGKAHTRKDDGTNQYISYF